MKRTELRRTGGPKRTSKLSPESPRHRTERELRRIVVELALTTHGCAARAAGAPGACTSGMDPDERIPRSGWAAGWLAVDNVQPLCRGHHEWKHAHSDAAKLLGLRASAGAPRPPYLTVAEVPELGVITWATHSRAGALLSEDRLWTALRGYPGTTITTTSPEEPTP